MIYRQWNEYVHQTHFATSYFCCHKYSSSTLSDLRLVTRYIWYTPYFQSSTRIALEHDVWISVFSSFLVSWPFFHAPKHVHRRSRAALSTCLPRSPLDGPVQWALNRPWLFFFEPSYVFRSIVDLAEGVASFTCFRHWHQLKDDVGSFCDALRFAFNVCVECNGLSLSSVSSWLDPRFLSPFSSSSIPLCPS